jgi:hypothetical protein
LISPIFISLWAKAECAMPLNMTANPAPKKYLFRRIPNPPLLKKLS